MITTQDLNYQIDTIQLLHDEFIAYNDSINLTDTNEKVYVTSENLLSSTYKCAYTAIQQIEQQKRDSLTEYYFYPKFDTTLFNICFDTYGVVSEGNIEKLIVANDLNGINRTDIDPTDPIIKKGTKIIYYK